MLRSSRGSRFGKFYDLAKGWVCGIDDRRCAPVPGGPDPAPAAAVNQLGGCANTLPGKASRQARRCRWLALNLLLGNGSALWGKKIKNKINQEDILAQEFQPPFTFGGIRSQESQKGYFRHICLQTAVAALPAAAVIQAGRIQPPAPSSEGRRGTRLKGTKQQDLLEIFWFLSSCIRGMSQNLQSFYLLESF